MPPTLQALPNRLADDRAVSPVIAVILMVAMTVILASVTGVFTLDLAGELNRNAQAGVSFEQSGSGPYNVTVRVVSMGSSSSVTVVCPSESVSTGTTLTEAGATDTCTGLSANQTIDVAATRQGETTLIQSYTVKGE